MSFHIIGDIHGQAGKLKALLHQLGYEQRQGAYRHPGARAIFVGDFIDRGPHQLETLDIVRRMVDAGSARAIMGNHEFNAIAWHTPDPDAPGEYLRPRGGRKGDKNRGQHQAFLRELQDLAACVDYSAGKNGPLVAYRWEQGGPLEAARFVSSADT